MKPTVRLLFVCCLALVSSHVLAEGVAHDAGKHFSRGVDLYNDGDFRGALVEFKRAYTLLPRANVLYDIGETEFQLQDYAAALTTMRRFLSETGPTALHRAEVETTVEILRGRVGKVAITSDLSHCDVSVDEQPVGTTPLPESLVVSVGARRIGVACKDRPIEVRRIEIAAGELARVDVRLGPVLTVPLRDEPPPKISLTDVRRRQRTTLTVSWTSTALLAAALLCVGTSSLVESSQLATLRDRSYPIQADTIDRKAALTHGLSIAADTLGIAMLTAVGISTYVTVKARHERKLVLGLGLGGASVRGTF